MEEVTKRYISPSLRKNFLSTEAAQPWNDLPHNLTWSMSLEAFVQRVGNWQGKQPGAGEKIVLVLRYETNAT